MKTITPGDIQVTEITLAVYQWPDIVPFQSAPRHTVVEKSFVQGVRVEMTRETWDEIMQVWLAHQQHIQNPAVRDAWDQYCMVRVLAEQNRPVLLRK